jgi:ribosomal protein S18 acetylase RimI-like enzyme
MNIALRRESMAAIAEHARIPIAFQVDSVLVVSILDSGLGGFVLSERKLETPYVKDYDAIVGEGPTSWTERFDVSNWGFISAHIGDRRVGGAVIAFNTAGIEMLQGRNDLAVLWDIRVRPEDRRRGVGSALFMAAEQWAAERRCCQLKVETQNINVAACRFYARHGCVLGAINRFAYRSTPDETQLLWYKNLTTSKISD